MAKIKNTGKSPRGFIDDQGLQHTVQPGEEAEINLTEADFDKLKELLEKEKEDQENDPAMQAVDKNDRPPPSFELGGSAGGKAHTGATISATGSKVDAPPKAEDKPSKK